MVFTWLLSKRALLHLSTKSRQLIREKLPHTDNIGSSFFISRDRGDRYGFPKSVDEMAGERIYLLEVAIQLRCHLRGL